MIYQLPYTITRISPKCCNESVFYFQSPCLRLSAMRYALVRGTVMHQCAGMKILTA